MKTIILLFVSFTSFFTFSQNFVQLDPSFGPSGNPVNIGIVNSGVSANVFSHYSQIRKISISPSGDIISFGSIKDTDGFENFGISKYKPNGTLDTDFGNNGFISYSWYQSDLSTHYFGDRIYSGGIQSTGKILAVGLTEENRSGYGNGVIYREACILRLNENGSVDSTFGNNGKVTGNYNNHIASTYHDIKVLPNDYFYSIMDEYDTSGYYTSSLAKHKADGTFDSTFANNGIASEGESFIAWGVEIQNDNKILVSGYGWYDSAQAVIKRFNVNGTIDTTFGNAGTVVQDFGSYTWGEERYSQVIVQPDGKIVASGWAGNYKDTTANEYTSDMIIARYNTDGTLDNSFGNNGIIRQDILSTDNNEGRLNRTYAGGVLLSDGSLLFNSYEQSNYSYTGENDRIGFFKYTTNGVLDNNFGNNGHYNVTLLSDPSDYLYIRMDDMKLLPNDKILLGGNIATGSGVNSSYPFVSNLLLQFTLNNTVNVNITMLNKELNIFPNPSSDRITISSEEHSQIQEVSIYNLEGKVIESFLNFRLSNTIPISISSFTKGSYILQVKFKNGSNKSTVFIKN